MSKTKFYTIYTILFTFLVWGILVVGNAFDISFLKYGTPIGMIIFVLGGNILPIVCIIATLKYDKISCKEYLKKTFSIKEKPYLYLMMFGLVVPYFVIPAIFKVVHVIAPLWYLPVLVIPLTFIGGGLEEMGWRGILQPNLRKNFSFITSTFITSIIWTSWHIPLFLIKGTSQYNTNFIIFFITVIGLSFALAIVHELSNSTWLCILFHGMINTGLSVFAVNNSYVSAIIMSLCMILISTIIYIKTKNKRF